MSTAILSDRDVHKALTLIDALTPRGALVGDVDLPSISTHDARLDALTAIGQGIKALNAEAYSKRYGEPVEPEDYRHRYYGLIQDTDSMVTHFKALEACLYQCNEAGLRETGLYLSLEKIARDAAVQISRGLASYRAAPWLEGDKL